MSLGLKTRRKWEQLHQSLRAEIINGAYQRGDEIPSHTALARKYGTSVPTVREAITALIRDKMLVCIQGKGTFVSEKFVPPAISVEVVAAASATSRQAYSVVNILSGIGVESRVSGLATQMYTTELNQDGLVNTAYHEVLAKAQGALILPGTSDAVYHWCNEKKLPVVLADGNKLRTDVRQVTYDRRKAARDAVKYLYDSGHRRIACIISFIGPYAGGTPEQRRLMGFFDAVSDCVLDMPSGYLVQCEKQSDLLRAATARLLLCSPRPTAICCSTDLIASAVMGVLAEQGIRVPQDMSLVSFSNCLDWQYPQIRLTGVSPPFEQIGREAVRMLRDIVDGKAETAMSAIVPGEFVIGDSCGPPPAVKNEKST